MPLIDLHTGHNVGYMLYISDLGCAKHSASRAQWLRDTANQFAHYHLLLSQDKELATLVKAVINNEARYVSQYPYCGAFQPPPESGLAPSHNDWADGVTVNP